MTDGNGMPLANCTTPANGSERDQVIPLLDSVKVKTNKPGRHVNEFKYLRGTLVMIPRTNVLPYVSAVSDPNGPSVLGRVRKIGVDQLKFQFRVFNKSAVLLGFNENIADLLFDGNEFLPALMLLCPLAQFTSGLTEFY